GVLTHVRLSVPFGQYKSTSPETTFSTDRLGVRMGAVLAKARADGRFRLSQEQIILIVVASLFVVFSVLLDGFFTADNLLNLLRSVSSLGILSVETLRSRFSRL